MLQGEATATVVVVDLDSVVSVVDLEEDLGEVKAAEVDSDSGGGNGGGEGEGGAGGFEFGG